MSPKRSATKSRTAPAAPVVVEEPGGPRLSLLPQPWLTATLVGLWLLLVNSLDPRQLLLGLFYGWLIPLFTHLFVPLRPTVRSWKALFRFLPVFVWDIVVANVGVALLVLNVGKRPRSHWIVVPLESTNPYTISTLACVITLTPGTVSAEFSADRRSLLVHSLDTGDPEAEVANIKRRYEAPIMEIFG
jgi:multicomponent K+:H+ antiporter subunit E